jgi:CRISPR-associated protein (TIGR02584 family)
MEPHQFPHRVLLAVTGLSPQVVTETLYALAVQAPAPFVPTEIHLLTTAEGAERARLSLLHPKSGWFHRLRADYGLPDIAFGPEHIQVLTAGDGSPLSDIRTLEDNTQAADAITERVRRFTAAADSALHVSIAGGRKTMGFYLGYALSLFGRPQDRLSHVLVSPPYESHPQFFYPTPDSEVIYTAPPDNRPYDTRDAEVTLAEIPFVSLRHGLPEALLAGRASFRATVEAARAALAPPLLVLDPASHRVQAAGQIFSLPPAQFALLAVFARRIQSGAAPLRAPCKDVPDPEWTLEYRADLLAVCGEFQVPDSVERALDEAMAGDYFAQHLSRLRKTLKQRLGPAALPYVIDDGGVRPRRYRLKLAPESVRFEIGRAHV